MTTVAIREPANIAAKNPTISQPALKQVRPEQGSMLHLKCALDEKVEPTNAMTLGSALNVAFLEPELMPQKVALWTAPVVAKESGKSPAPRTPGKRFSGKSVGLHTRRFPTQLFCLEGQTEHVAHMVGNQTRRYWIVPHRDPSLIDRIFSNCEPLP